MKRKRFQMGPFSTIVHLLLSKLDFFEEFRDFTAVETSAVLASSHAGINCSFYYIVLHSTRNNTRLLTVVIKKSSIFL